MDRFEDAVASLETATPEELSTDHARRERLYLLTAAHAHLGHTSEAASARAELEAITDNVTNLRAMHALPFKQPGDFERLRRGLEKAGIPDFPFGYKAKDQLTGEEVRSLVFGHEFRGRQIDPDEPYTRTTSTEGVAHVSIGSSFSATAISRVEGDFLCSLWDSEVEVTCAAIFPNPGGMPEKENEYVWVAPNSRAEFSVVK